MRRAVTARVVERAAHTYAKITGELWPSFFVECAAFTVSWLGAFHAEKTRAFVLALAAGLLEPEGEADWARQKAEEQRAKDALLVAISSVRAPRTVQ